MEIFIARGEKIDYKKYDIEERNKQVDKIASELFDVIRGNKVTLYEFSLIMESLERKVSKSTIIGGEKP